MSESSPPVGQSEGDGFSKRGREGPSSVLAPMRPSMLQEEGWRVNRSKLDEKSEEEEEVVVEEEEE